MAAKINNQKGFATLEIIFIMLIISILAGSVIPKFSRSLDIIGLDCENKRFISNFYFAKSLNRTANYSGNIFFGLNLAAHQIQMNVTAQSYYLQRNSLILGDKHYLADGMTIKFANSDSKIFHFNDEEDYYKGSSENIFIISKSGRKSELVVDSVGRIRRK